MTFSLDPEIAAALVERFQAADSTSAGMPERGDALGLRALVDPMMMETFKGLPDTPRVRSTSFATTVSDGTEIHLRMYTHRDRTSRRRPVVLYVHGGGMICGSVAIYDRLMRHYVEQTGGVPFLAVEYRLAPEHRDSTAAEDSYAAIRWLLDHADELEIDRSRIAVMGDSAGAGIAAGAAILARDRGILLAKQILIYPMLDDRTLQVDPLLAPTATWSYDDNFTGWKALLGEALGKRSVPPAVAPARLENFQGLAPAYIEVGELDIFRQETLDYASRLHQAGVSCELHVHPGAPHGYDWLSLRADLTRRALADRYRVIRGL